MVSYQYLSDLLNMKGWKFMKNNINCNQKNIFNQPVPSKTHSVLHALKLRKMLSTKDDRRLKLFETGFNGEMQFHALLQEKLTVPHIPIYNLQLESNMSEFQLDCLLIFRNLIHLVEVKNFYGDYIAGDDHWIHAKTKDPVKNPLHQVSRSGMYLNFWLKMNRISLPVIYHVIFMNPSFFLYEATLSMQIILPSQHHSYLKRLQKNYQSLSNQHEQLASKLKASHITQSPHEYIPEYSYSELQKGIFCNSCLIALPKPRHNYFQCKRCGNREQIAEALFRTIKEFQLMFPEFPLTVNSIIEWTGGVLSKNTIRRCLIKNFEQQGNGRGTYYL